MHMRPLGQATVFERRAEGTRLDSDDHFPTELTVKPPHVIPLMVQLPLLQGPIFGVQLAHRLLPRVDVYSYV